ncbi:hypothetical protein HDU76_005409 [Blyttiomyces sp. JEL0837]|nr:hypothetical protein HDU76_005409 [Blyttiomyces sp. JEL0837]
MSAAAASPSTAANDRPYAILPRPPARPEGEYELIIRQQPIRARMCGFSEIRDKRLIDPPPIVQVVFKRGNDVVKLSPQECATLICHASLWSANGREERAIVVRARGSIGDDTESNARSPLKRRNDEDSGDIGDAGRRGSDSMSSGKTVRGRGPGRPRGRGRGGKNIGGRGRGGGGSGNLSRRTSGTGDDGEDENEDEESGGDLNMVKAEDSGVPFSGSGNSLPPSLWTGYPASAHPQYSYPPPYPTSSAYPPPLPPQPGQPYGYGYPYSSTPFMSSPHHRSPMYHQQQYDSTTPALSLYDLLKGDTSGWSQTLVGSSVTSCCVLKDVDGTEGMFFVFNDLSVRTQGLFRLKFHIVDVNR